MIFSLNRFNFDLKTYERIKIENSFDFPFEFNCSEFSDL